MATVQHAQGCAHPPIQARPSGRVPARIVSASEREAWITGYLAGQALVRAELAERSLLRRVMDRLVVR